MTRRLMMAGCLAIIFSSFAFGQTVRTWVSASGSDINACSRNAPCRNFSAAITAVDAGGEVVVLDSAGYGPVTITKGVSIIAPAGVHAAIAPSSGNAITINPGMTGAVLLRNLFLNSQGANYGVMHQGADNLFIEDCQISGFAFVGIQAVPSAPAYLSVKGCAVRNGMGGITLGGVSANFGQVDGTVLENLSEAGILASGSSRLSVRNTISANNGRGFMVEDSAASMEVTDSAAFHCNVGFYAVGSSVAVTMHMDRCVATSNTTGLAVAISAGSSGPRLSVATSLIANNATGVAEPLTGTSIQTRGDNTLEDNNLGNAFNFAFPTK